MAGMPDRVKKRYVRIPKPIITPENSSGISHPDINAHWHSRGYLPHHENWNKIQGLTFRLADALPQHVVERLAHELETPEGNAAYYHRLESYLDAGHGACSLRQPLIASVVKNAFLFYDIKRYHLHAWVIMPNHVHFIIEPISSFTLSKIIKDWKSFTSKEINRQLGREGQVWQEEYWDRYMRDGKHYENAKKYIQENPVKAGLVKRAEDWPWMEVRQGLFPKSETDS